MKLRQILLLSAFLLMMTGCPASADINEVPTLPAQFSGTLYNHEGKPFPVGTVITAEVNGITSTYTITEAGKIGGTGTFDEKFLISGAVAGSEITFKIAGTNTEVKHHYNPESPQQIQQIQLTIPLSLTESAGGNGGVSGGGYTASGTVSQNPTLPDTPDSGDEILPPIEDPIPQTPETPKTPYPLMISILALIGTAYFAGRK